jgi:hypothetical protein
MPAGADLGDDASKRWVGLVGIPVHHGVGDLAYRFAIAVAHRAADESGQRDQGIADLAGNAEPTGAALKPVS